MDTDANRFRVLLAEDDPVSREFLAEALRACGAEVVACADGVAALALARAQPWDLLLLDHHLPGLTGDGILVALARDPGHSAARAPAIAITAEPDAARRTLLDAGFVEVLPKPISIADLRVALRRHGCRTAAVLDDDDALRACGSAATVAHLRQLFVEQELPALLAEIERCRESLQGLRPVLHRLRASCGFCGARALGEASAALHRALATDDNHAQVATALAAFEHTISQTRAALHDSLASGT